MKTKAIKLYEEEGTKYQFDSEKFKVLINQKKLSLNKAHKKTTKAEIMESIADEMCVSTEAIKNWMYGYNGPSDLEQVKKIGDYFETDYHFLLNKEEDTMSTTTINTFDGSAQALYTRERVRELYASLLKYVNRGAYYQMEIADLKGFCEEDMKLAVKMPDLMHQASEEMYSILDETIELLNSYLLDIPEGLFDRLYNYTCERQDDVIEYYRFTYAAADEGEGREAELWINEDALEQASDYFYGKGMKELRELFKDYIVR